MQGSEAFSRRGLIGSAAALGLGASLGPTPVLASMSARPTLTQRLAKYLVTLRFEDLPEAAVERAKEHLIYHVGLALQGAGTQTGRDAVRIASKLSHGHGATTVIGQPGRFATLDAAFANASQIRVTGFDDVLFPSATHAGLLVYPVAMAVAEAEGQSGREFLTAVVAGYEILGKLAVDFPPDRTPRRLSMPFGAFAGAAAAARLMRLDPERTAAALGYAADSAMGLKEGHEQQPTHVYGWIVRNAVFSAMLAQEGGDVSRTVLEGKYGFYRTVLGLEAPGERLVESLGRDPEILRATQKRFPGTAMNIVPVQFMLEMANAHGLNEANVAVVEIELPEDRRTFEDSISLGPYASRTQAESAVAFQVAIILMDGRIDFARYQQWRSSEILSVAQRVKIRLAPHDNTRFARVVVRTRDGRTFSRQGSEYAFPPIDGAVWLKERANGALPAGQLRDFVALVQELEAVPDMRQVMSRLAAAA